MIERWGIRARVTLVAFVPMLVVAVLMTATHTSLRLSDLDQALRARAHAHARQLAAATEYAIFAGDRETLGQLADALMLEDDVAAIAIFDADGKVLVSTGAFATSLPATPAHPAPEQELRTSTGRWLRIVEPIRPSQVLAEDAFSAGGVVRSAVAQAPLGRLVLDMSLVRMQRRRSELLWIVA